YRVVWPAWRVDVVDSSDRVAAVAGEARHSALCPARFRYLHAEDPRRRALPDKQSETPQVAIAHRIGRARHFTQHATGVEREVEQQGCDVVFRITIGPHFA